MLGFFWTSLRVPFPFADFSWYPFTIINCSHDYDYMLSPVSLSGESSHLDMVLGTLIQHAYLFHGIYVMYLKKEVRRNQRVGLNAISRKI